jgi:hypothetical protein
VDGVGAGKRGPSGAKSLWQRSNAGREPAPLAGKPLTRKSGQIPDLLARTFADFCHRELARISHTAAKRNAGEACGNKAREGQRVQAYLNRTSGTVIERNEVDTGLSCVAAVGA